MSGGCRAERYLIEDLLKEEYPVTFVSHPSCRGGYRLRVFGQTANYTAEGGQVLTLPVSIPNKVLSAGATILLPSPGASYDQGAQIYGITPGSPASTIGIYIGAYSASITWPVSALYWVDGY